MSKSIVHHFFDEIFLVNLARKRGRKLKTFHYLRKNGIYPKIWEAVDGYSKENLSEFEEYKSRKLGHLHFEEYSELEIRRKSKFIDSPGAWGYIKTYLEILGYAVENKLKRILILEDDVILHNNFENETGDFLYSLNDNWKVVLLGASQYNWDSVNITDAMLNGHYSPRILHTCGSFAIGLDINIYGELSQNLEYMDAPFDHIPLGKIYERYNDECYVAYPNLVIPDVTESTIRKKRNQGSHSIKMKWKLSEFGFPVERPLITILFEDRSKIENIPIGASVLEDNLDINWIYYCQGQLIPVHNIHSPSLKYMTGETKKIHSHHLQILNPKNTSDYLIYLKDNVSYYACEILDWIEELIINGLLDPRIELLDPKSLFDSDCFDDLASIIIPTYRRANNLRAAIDSALNQTHKNLEVIIVDDNDPHSSDRVFTEQLMQEYQTDSRVKYIKHTKNLNGSAARNTGIMASKGSYISFLDDDDVLMPIKIEECLKKLRGLDNSYGAVYGGFLGWNSKGVDFDRFKSGDLTLEILTLSYKSHYLHTCTAVYKRSAILRINGFDDSFSRHQDLELNLRFFQYFKIGAVERIVAKLRPLPTLKSNLLKGDKFYDVKNKFLVRFRPLISKYSEDIQMEIYRAHWSEVAKYQGGPNNLFDKLKSIDSNGLYHYLLDGNQIDKLHQENVNLQSSVKKANDSLDISTQLVDRLTQQTKALAEGRDNLIQQKEWYENTYERLPWWWKKVGALIRRINQI